MPTFLFDFMEVLWLFFLISSLAMVSVIHRIAAVLVKLGTVKARDRWRFTLGGIAIFSLMGLSILGAQVLAGVRNPLCIGIVPGTQAIETAYNVLMGTLLALLGAWVWWGRSFTLLVHLAPILLHGWETTRPYSRRQVQLAVLGTVAALLLLGAAIDSSPPADRCGPGSELRFKWRIEFPPLLQREASAWPEQELRGELRHDVHGGYSLRALSVGQRTSIVE